MSSREVRRTGLGLLAAVVLLGLGGCASAAAGPADASSVATSAAVPADDLTQRIAAVEFARQCAVTTQAFADEAAITTDLDERLAAAGLTHAQWKKWHDELADSPALLGQLGQVRAPGCAGT